MKTLIFHKQMEFRLVPELCSHVYSSCLIIICIKLGLHLTNHNILQPSRTNKLNEDIDISQANGIPTCSRVVFTCLFLMSDNHMYQIRVASNKSQHSSTLTYEQIE